MAQLTKPTDLEKPVSQVDSMIEQIESAFKQKPKRYVQNPNTEYFCVYYIIKIKGGYSPEDVAEVHRRYTEAGWERVDIERVYEKSPTGKVTFTKFRFFEIT